MFTKLKNKLAEEVKSSPQRIQQFAQAAQAAVTSASSSISDITNSDLFSIGDNDPQNQPAKSTTSDNKNTTTQYVLQPSTLKASSESMEFASSQDSNDHQRQRRLSNSSFASDVSFRLPSYESPSIYHLQSDIEISASEAEERGFSSGAVSLDRVTKEQIYAAYRRTQERYTKYRTQYADLARHYKLLERENAKAKSVLVETQDKALRRISELREQCSLEQSAKAHLEKVLRVEIEEKNLKIDTLNTKIDLLQGNNEVPETVLNKTNDHEKNVQLINFDNENNVTSEEPPSSEISGLNNKIGKLEKLVNKYKDSLKALKDKSNQQVTENQLLSHELETKKKEIEQLKICEHELTLKMEQIQKLNDLNEDLQNKINTFDFQKSKEVTALEMDLAKSQEEISQLHSRIEIFTKREEEYAISLAENKLSIHKELDSKENEIKSLKDHLTESNQTIESLNTVINECRQNIVHLESEITKHTNDANEVAAKNAKISDLELQLQTLHQKYQSLENSKSKSEEEYKCLQLQLRQETAEKLAMIDRNSYLEERNMQLSEENVKKSSQINMLDNEIQIHKKEKQTIVDSTSENLKIMEEVNSWKNKYSVLESEIQEERDELVKLQSEIEKLLENHELVQIQNTELNLQIKGLESKNAKLQKELLKVNYSKSIHDSIISQLNDLKKLVTLSSREAKTLKSNNECELKNMKKNLSSLLRNMPNSNDMASLKVAHDEQKHLHHAARMELKQISEEYQAMTSELNVIREENTKLKQEINNNEIMKHEFEVKLEHNNKQREEVLIELNTLKNDKLLLEEKIIEHQSMHDVLKKRNSDCNNELIVLKQEQQKSISEIKRLENEKKMLIEENYQLTHDQKTKTDRLNSSEQENQLLLKKAEIAEEKLSELQRLRDEMNELSLENISLKSNYENISRSVRDLEVELHDVRKSHTDIVVEKDRLSAVIEQLEQKEKEKHLNTITVQTEIDDELGTLHEEHLEKKFHEIEDAIPTPENRESYICLKNENDSLKEDNKRLQSDITGLQTYLAKISRENSELNDKLRELIASSEHSDRNNFDPNLTELKERMNNLLRENSLLVEENLELKDQLSVQNYDKPPILIDHEQARNAPNSQEKYKNLLDTNNKMEKKILDLENINKSVSGSIMDIQEKNEKLRLTNEKLERRLDEALVSLRHLHSLQENTELEYLRNILYEYLTGTGTHSVTLAKVLAAVVKFDDNQTQLILQKEKERQGFLRQLGLI